MRACLRMSGSASSEAPTIAEFLIIAIVIEPSGGITVRNACGSTMRRSVWRLAEAERQRRLDLPAADREHAERSASATYAAVYRPRPRSRPSTGRSATPARRSPANAMNSRTSSGMLRNVST